MPYRSTLYLTASVSSGFLVMSPTAGSLATSGTGWTVAKVAPTKWGLMKAGVKQASTVFTLTSQPSTDPSSTAGDGFAYGPFQGLMPIADLEFSFPLVAVGAGGAQDVTIFFRLLHFVGSLTSPTQISEIVGGSHTTQALNLAVGTPQTVTATIGGVSGWSFPSNSYLVLQVALRIDGAGGSNSADAMLRLGASPAYMTIPLCEGVSLPLAIQEYSTGTIGSYSANVSSNNGGGGELLSYSALSSPAVFGEWMVQTPSIDIASSLAAAASISASLAVGVAGGIASSPLCEAACGGSLRVGVLLSASVTAAAGATGQLSDALLLSASLEASGSMSASLRLANVFAATIPASAVATASMATEIRVAADCSGAAFIAASAMTQIWMAAAHDCESAISCYVETGIRLKASASTSASAAASLESGIVMSASLVADTGVCRGRLATEVAATFATSTVPAIRAVAQSVRRVSAK